MHVIFMLLSCGSILMMMMIMCNNILWLLLFARKLFGVTSYEVTDRARTLTAKKKKSLWKIYLYGIKFWLKKREKNLMSHMILKIRNEFRCKKVSIRNRFFHEYNSENKISEKNLFFFDFDFQIVYSQFENKNQIWFWTIFHTLTGKNIKELNIISKC